MAPLFEVESNFLGFAKVPQRTHPNGIHRPGSMSAFSSRNNPINWMGVFFYKARKINIPQKRLATQKAHSSRNFEKKRKPNRRLFLIFHGRPNPDIRRPTAVIPWSHFENILGAFRQEEPVQHFGFLDKFPKFPTILLKVRPFFKNIGHACTKHTASFAGLNGFLIPTDWLTPMFLGEEPPCPVFSPHVLAHPFRPSLGVTICTSRRNLRATPPRVKCVMGPFDGGVHSHKAVCITTARS